MKVSLPVLTLVALGCALWHFSPLLQSRWQVQVQSWQARRSVEDTVRSTAYPIYGDDWLEFDLPSNATAIRLLTNAAVSNTALPPISTERPRRGWKYSVDYELLDEQLDPVEARRYHLRTRMTHRQDANTQDLEGQTWFRDSHHIPAQTRTVQVPLSAEEASPRRLRVRLGSRDDQIEEVVLRVYFRHQRDDYTEPYAWSRLSIDTRQRLCRASVYPPDLLTPWERRNLLRWNWTALPPIGQKGIHYQHRLIYQREDPQLGDLEFMPPPDGVACRPGSPVTVPTPREAGVTQLEFFPDHELNHGAEVSIDVRVHRQWLGAVAEQTLRLSEIHGPLRLDTRGDLVEFTASDHAICVAKWWPQGAVTAVDQKQVITLNSSAQKIRCYLASPAEPLEYEIAHVDQLATPFRVTLRRLVPQPASRDELGEPTRIAVAAVWYEFLDRDGQPVERGELATLPEIAHYDRAAIGTAPMQVSEPSTYFFALPLSVSKVRFRCDESDVAIIAFTRPRDLPRTFRVPEEQGLFEQQDEISRTWFMLRSNDHGRRIAENRCADISIQARPLTPHELLGSGQYEWEDHFPREFTAGRFALTPRDATFPVREEAFAAAYYELPVNQTLRVRWRAAQDDMPLRPHLIYSALSRHVAPVQIYINGSLHDRFVPRALRGEVSLPPIPRSDDPTSLRVVAPAGCRVYMNHIELPDAACYLKRFVHELGNQPLTFEVIKHTDDAEPLVLNTFRARTPDAAVALSTDEVAGLPRLEIQVRLLDGDRRRGGPLRGWTLEQRVFQIAASSKEPALLIAGTQQLIDQGEHCAVILAEDLPAGRYRLEVRRVALAPEPTFVSLTRIRPPARSKRQSQLDLWPDTLTGPGSARNEHAAGRRGRFPSTFGPPLARQTWEDQ